MIAQIQLNSLIIVLHSYNVDNNEKLISWCSVEKLYHRITIDV